MRSPFTHCVLIVALAGSCAHAAAADVYPVKSVRIVIGFSPGGYIDLTSRLVAGPLSAALGQQVVVDNRSGAGGVVGTEIAARSAPDGYTLTIGSIGTHAINQTLYRKLPYNVLKDFQPIARLSDAPNILAVHPSFPAKSVKDLLALAKARPGQVMYASAGAGTSTHIAAVLFEYLGHVKLVHVPYKGGGPALIDVVAGQVPVTFATAASVSPHTKSGRLRGLGITGSQRSTLLPALPTIAESGLPGYEMINWLGLFAPTGTPRALVDKLAAESLRVVQLPEVRERLNAQGAEPSPLGTDEFTPFVKKEVEKWGKVVTLTGMTAE
ncbi:MAG: tripartite tricarboxylate transporter substrate binding protein [Betaproteobacteria bacterium]